MKVIKQGEYTYLNRFEPGLGWIFNIYPTNVKPPRNTKDDWRRWQRQLNHTTLIVKQAKFVSHDGQRVVILFPDGSVEPTYATQRRGFNDTGWIYDKHSKWFKLEGTGEVRERDYPTTKQVEVLKGLDHAPAHQSVNRHIKGLVFGKSQPVASQSTLVMVDEDDDDEDTLINGFQ